MNHTKIKIYCINRKKDTDRREFMEKQLKKLPFSYKFIEAIEGELIDLNDESTGYDRKKRKFYFTQDLKKSEVACFLSHKKALQQFLQDQYPYAVILEDDANIENSFSQTIEQLLTLPTTYWDIIKLESRSLRGCKINGSEPPLFFPFKYGGATALFYHRKSAQIVVNYLQHFFLPIDVHLGHLASTKIKLYSLLHPIVHEERKTLPSTIGNRTFSNTELTFTFLRLFHSSMKRFRCVFQKISHPRSVYQSTK